MQTLTIHINKQALTHTQKLLISQQVCTAKKQRNRIKIVR